MSGKKIFITIAAISAVGAGTAGIILNSGKMRTRRMMKKVGNTLYAAGNVLRALSCKMVEG